MSTQTRAASPPPVSSLPTCDTWLPQLAAMNWFLLHIAHHLTCGPRKPLFTLPPSWIGLLHPAPRWETLQIILLEYPSRDTLATHLHSLEPPALLNNH